jgi:hypothetical protein
MKTTAERNRSSRRTSFVAIAVSGALHVAVLLWLRLPGPQVATPAERLALLPPLSEAVMLQVEVVTQRSAPAAQSATAEAGGAGEAGPVAAAPRQVTPQPVTPDAAVSLRPVPGEQLALAALDSLVNTDVTAQPVAETAPAVVATLPAGESGEGQAAQPAPAAPAHIPGSAARAKGGGVSPGSGGSGKNGGLGGITIKVGGGPKKHPPRGMPGRGRW